MSYIFFSCRKQPIIEKRDNWKSKKEIEFKNWLKDTLNNLKKTSYNKEYKRIIDISKDSLSLNISKSYDTILTTDKEIKKRELDYAIELLKINNELPKEKFRLKMTIIQSYNSPMVEQLIYDYDYEIKQFSIEQKNITTNYNFAKGNLIEKTIKH